MVSRKGCSSPPAERSRRKPARRAGKPGAPGGSVSEKLEALKSLVPSENKEAAMKPDRLFQETADYIVLLRTQVIVLQKLIDFYGSRQPQQNRNPV